MDNGYRFGDTNGYVRFRIIVDATIALLSVGERTKRAGTKNILDFCYLAAAMNG